MDAFETLLNDAVKDGTLPGAVVYARDRNGQLDYSYAVSGPTGDYQADTVLELASLTKLTTSIAALQLVEKGLVGLDEDVAEFIPGFARQSVLDGFDVHGNPLTHQRKSIITLRLLLSHSAGSGYPFNDQRLAKYQKTNTDTATTNSKGSGTIDGMFDFPLSYEPGEGWLYGNGLDRVGQIIEKVSGQSLEDYMTENIWEPLGITTGTFRRGKIPAGVQPPTLAVRSDPNGPAMPDPSMKTFTTGLTECFGGQGLFMSMRDYIKILHSLLVDDERILRSETAALLFRPSLSPKSKESLLNTMEQPNWAWAVGDFPPTREYDWSLGGLLVDGDSHDHRKRNMLMWSGGANLFWFVDREAGVCGVFGTQVLPAGDPRVRPVIKAFEDQVYSVAS